jgi:hypothetical protein
LKEKKEREEKEKVEELKAFAKEREEEANNLAALEAKKKRLEEEGDYVAAFKVEQEMDCLSYTLADNEEIRAAGEEKARKKWDSAEKATKELILQNMTSYQGPML